MFDRECKIQKKAVPILHISHQLELGDTGTVSSKNAQVSVTMVLCNIGTVCIFFYMWASE